MSIRNIGTEAKPNYEVRVVVRRKNARGMICRQRRGITNLREATQTERELYEECFALAKGLRADMRWHAIVDLYLSFVKKEGRLSPISIYQYETVLKSPVLSAWKNSVIGEITGRDVRNLIDSSPQQLKWTVTYQRFVKNILSSVFRFACDHGYCKINPCQSVRYKAPEPDIDTWNIEQVRQFLALAREADSPWRPIWEFALYSGLRSMELWSLQYRHIDLQGKLIRVAQNYSAKTGFKAPKNRKVRLVPINPPLEKLLNELMGHSIPEPEAFVLPRIKAWKNGDQARELQKFLKGTGLPVIHFHGFRRIFATECLRSGMPINQLMAVCGWSDLSSAMRYLKLSGIPVAGSTHSLDFSEDSKSGEASILPFHRRRSRP
jgi:integrase